MKCIDELSPPELKGKRVFLRTSLNLPLASDGSVEDIFRLQRALPTVRYLVKCGAKVIIAGYLGRKGDSMRPVAEALIKQAPDIRMYFFGTPFEMASSESQALKDGECLILESTRRHPGEETNDEAFVGLLAGLADIFVSDAFAEAHRDYASNVALAKKLPAYCGLLLRDEVKELSRAREPEKPSLAILGGAKFETKAPLIRQLLRTYDHVFVTGALANDVFKARGLPVGRSLISAELPGPDVLDHPHFVVPVDVTVERLDKQARVKKPTDVEPQDKIVDIGPDSVKEIAPLIATAKFILWNGPTGLYEEGYSAYTYSIAELIAKSSARKIIGGGDTIAAIKDSGVPDDELGFLSTGGGAMLEYLLKGTLPGVAALEK
jgi:3-phosphoglycerate kinase